MPDPRISKDTQLIHRRLLDLLRGEIVASVRSLSEADRLLGLPSGTVSALLRGNVRLSTEMLLEIGRVLNINVAFVVGRALEPEKERQEQELARRLVRMLVTEGPEAPGNEARRRGRRR